MEDFRKFSEEQMQRLDSYISAHPELHGHQLARGELTQLFQAVMGQQQQESSWLGWLVSEEQEDPTLQAQNMVIQWNMQRILGFGVNSGVAYDALSGAEARGEALNHTDRNELEVLLAIRNNLEELCGQASEYCKAMPEQELEHIDSAILRRLIELSKKGLSIHNLNALRKDLLALGEGPLLDICVLDFLRAAAQDPEHFKDLLQAALLRYHLFDHPELRELGPAAIQCMRSYLADSFPAMYHNPEGLAKYFHAHGPDAVLRLSVAHMLRLPAETMRKMGWSVEQCEERRQSSRAELELFCNLSSNFTSPRERALINDFLASFDWAEDALTSQQCTRVFEILCAGRAELNNQELNLAPATVAHACLAIVKDRRRIDQVGKECRQFQRKNQKILDELDKRLKEPAVKLLRGVSRLFPLGAEITDPGSTTEASSSADDSLEDGFILYDQIQTDVEHAWVVIVTQVQQFQQENGLEDAEMIAVINRLVAVHGVMALSEFVRTQDASMFNRRLHAELLCHRIELQRGQPMSDADQTGLRALITSSNLAEEFVKTGHRAELCELLGALCDTHILDAMPSIMEKNREDNLTDILTVCHWALVQGFGLRDAAAQELGILSAYMSKLHKMRALKQLDKPLDAEQLKLELLHEPALCAAMPHLATYRKKWEGYLLAGLNTSRKKSCPPAIRDQALQNFLDQFGCHTVYYPEKMDIKLFTRGIKLLGEAPMGLADLSCAWRNCAQAKSVPSFAAALYSATQHRRPISPSHLAGEVTEEELRVEFFDQRCRSVLLSAFQESELMRAPGVDQELADVLYRTVGAELRRCLSELKLPCIFDQHCSELVTLFAEHLFMLHHSEHVDMQQLAKLLRHAMGSGRLVVKDMLNPKKRATISAKGLTSVFASLNHMLDREGGGEAVKLLKKEPLTVLATKLPLLVQCLEPDEEAQQELYSQLNDCMRDFVPKLKGKPGFEMMRRKMSPQIGPLALVLQPILQDLKKEGKLSAWIGEACYALEGLGEDEAFEGKTVVAEQTCSMFKGLCRMIFEARLQLRIGDETQFGGLASFVRTLEAYWLGSGASQAGLYGCLSVVPTSWIAPRLASAVSGMLLKDTPPSLNRFVELLLTSLLSRMDARKFASVLVLLLNQSRLHEVEPIDRLALAEGFRSVLLELRETEKFEAINKILTILLPEALGMKL